MNIKVMRIIFGVFILPLVSSCSNGLHSGKPILNKGQSDPIESAIGFWRLDKQKFGSETRTTDSATLYVNLASEKGNLYVISSSELDFPQNIRAKKYQGGYVVQMCGLDDDKITVCLFVLGKKDNDRFLITPTWDKYLTPQVKKILRSTYEKAKDKDDISLSDDFVDKHGIELLDAIGQSLPSIKIDPLDTLELRKISESDAEKFEIERLRAEVRSEQKKYEQAANPTSSSQPVPPALADDPPETYTNSIGMEFALIPAGSFMMGSNASCENCGSDELPQHRVRIASPFYLGVTEVTQEQWVTVMGGNPSNFKSRTNPVKQVSWNDAQAFIRALNTKEGCSNCYRLPSEAEWEYAARAGTTTTYWFGDSADELGQYAWFADNSNDKTHPVGQTPANPWGLYDMHGNVFEWVQDCYHESYSGAPTDGSAWTTGCYKQSDGSILRGLRGCAGRSLAYRCRVASRSHSTPDGRGFLIGFRVVRVVSPGLR